VFVLLEISVPETYLLPEVDLPDKETKREAWGGADETAM